MTPDGDEGDSSSVSARSTKSVRVHRTEAERLRVLSDHPKSGDVEQHRVYCKQCMRWVNLGHRRNYELHLWYKHREKCDKSDVEAKAWVSGPLYHNAGD